MSRPRKAAERGLFDLMFSADALTGERYDRETLSRTSYVAWIDPMSLLTALAPVTQNIGLVCTATTTYDEPYHIARRFASLDLISGGRSGWNLVTSANDAEVEEFRPRGSPAEGTSATGAPANSSRSCAGCGTSWDDDAFVFDKEDGRFYDPDRRHVLDHVGEFFKVRGPLTVSRSPQGQPVVVQAGASDDGRQLAAETAEVVFCAHQSIDGARRILSRRQGAHGALRPRSRSSQGDARPRRHGRADAAGGAGQVPGAAGPHPSRRSASRCCPNTCSST